MSTEKQAGFTLPGESGHETLTIALAKLWGADMLRDSNGAQLSEELLDSGLGIYSTICLIREDNQWAKANQNKLQQNFLMSDPVTAESSSVEIDLLAGYSADQFQVNDEAESVALWQVFDRTSGEEIPRSQWELSGPGHVTINSATPWHEYTVNFLAVRIWEEISMYNHITNDWGDAERLLAVDPRHPEVAAHLLEWLEQWCIDHPNTSVVRFTSLFYNFAWFWGSDVDLPHRYTDWGSYDFTVSPLAIRQFTEQTGLKITSEDFINAGRYNSTHNPPSPIYRQWMEFIGEFVRDLGKQCVEIVHRFGKKALVFYDDSWIGLEPQDPRFTEFGFDGIIKALFSGYEVRLCAGVPTKVHELRLHPYLFPVDLEGKPTFSAGGHPEQDLRRFWPNIRRAMLRVPIERIGLGGYPSLTENYPAFVDEVASVAAQHREIFQLHSHGTVSSEPVTVGILTAWGSLRTWSTSGHLHESPDLSLTHILDSLSGLPVSVRFLSFEDLQTPDTLKGIDVLINAGPQGSAWSGGERWLDPQVLSLVRAWIADGGGFIGVDAPSAAARGLNTFQLADALGVDVDLGDRYSVAKRSFTVTADHPLLADGASVCDIEKPGVFLTHSNVRVLAAKNGAPLTTAADYHRGRTVYLSQFRHDASQSRLLDNAIMWAARKERTLPWSTNPNVEAALFEGEGALVLVNNSQTEQTATVLNLPKPLTVTLPGGALQSIPLGELE